jgi:hypothetical protein
MAFTAVTKWLGRKHVFTRPGVDEITRTVAVGKMALKGWQQSTVEVVVDAAVGLGSVPNAALWQNQNQNQKFIPRAKPLQ